MFIETILSSPPAWLPIGCAFLAALIFIAVVAILVGRVTDVLERLAFPTAHKAISRREDLRAGKPVKDRSGRPVDRA